VVDAVHVLCDGVEADAHERHPRGEQRVDAPRAEDAPVREQALRECGLARPQRGWKQPRMHCRLAADPLDADVVLGEPVDCEVQPLAAHYGPRRSLGVAEDVLVGPHLPCRAAAAPRAREVAEVRRRKLDVQWLDVVIASGEHMLHAVLPEDPLAALLA
jgi:hypothetical protein